MLTDNAYFTSDTCTLGRLICSKFVHELSTNAADAGMVRYDFSAANKSFWQRRSSRTDDVELSGQRWQTVWYYNSPADWERYLRYTLRSVALLHQIIISYTVLVLNPLKYVSCTESYFFRSFIPQKHRTQFETAMKVFSKADTVFTSSSSTGKRPTLNQSRLNEFTMYSF